jgi:signal transduction histidine kinase
VNLFVLLAAGAAFLVVLALPLRRLSPRGGGTEWALAWCALFSSGLMLRLSDSVAGLRILYPAMGTVFAGLLFAGARRYAGRDMTPRLWLLIGALAIVRGIFVFAAPPLVTTIGAVCTVSTGAILSMAEIARARDPRRAVAAEQLLLVGLLALVPTSSYYEWTKYRGADLHYGFFLWLVSGCFVAGTQIAAIFEQYRGDLERRLEERGEQLRASLLRIEEQQRLVAVGTLAAGIAHQINNPIGAITAAAEFAIVSREDPDADRVRDDALETVLEEARRCGRIVRSLLQFARDEPTTKWREDLNPVVFRASEQVRTYVTQRGGRLRIELAREPLPVRMSPIDLEQVVVNLIRNGAESRESGATVEVESRREAGSAVLVVSDDGNGIDAGLRRRVLEPFFTTRLAQGGSGLGLSVTHGIVTDHGGRVEIESRSRSGTRVCIRLPLASDLPEPA